MMLFAVQAHIQTAGLVKKGKSIKIMTFGKLKQTFVISRITKIIV